MTIRGPNKRPLRGIEEWLLRWKWRLPADFEPVKVTSCRHCGENILLVHTPEGHTERLTREGSAHKQHPISRSLPGDVSLDETDHG